MQHCDYEPPNGRFFLRLLLRLWKFLPAIRTTIKRTHYRNLTMPDTDKAAEKEFFKQLIKELFKEGLFKDAFKDAVTDIVQEIVNYCGRWTLKCIAGAALVGIIYLGLIGSGWKK